MRKEEEEGREDAFLSSGNQNRRKDEKEKIVNRVPPTPQRKRKKLGHPSFETPPPFFSDPCVNPLRPPDSFRIDVPLEALAARHHYGGSRRKRGWTSLTGRVRKGGSLSLSPHCNERGRGSSSSLSSPPFLLAPLSFFLSTSKKKMAFALASPARVAARTSAVAAPRRGSAVVVRASASEPVDRRAVLGAGLAGKELRERNTPWPHRP